MTWCGEDGPEYQLAQPGQTLIKASDLHHFAVLMVTGPYPSATRIYRLGRPLAITATPHRQ